MNLFIDTNVFLSFYHFSSDDLEELKKLGVLVQGGEVNLFLPEQVVTEFQRNRASKIAEALKRLRDQNLRLQFPQLCREYVEYDELRRLQKEYLEQHTQLIGRIEQDVAAQSLRADAIIQELFAYADRVSTSSSIVEKARFRAEVGNPPGKKGSLGDAINWEALLETIPGGENLFFITDDKDFFSPLDDDLLDPFLNAEWVSSKESQIHFYKRLSSFFNDRFPDIELASELEKDLLIRELGNSHTFARTHTVVSRLSRYSDFTPAQINDIVTATVTNNQVYWIIDDEDVHEFVMGVVRGQENNIDQYFLQQLQELLREEQEEDEIPF